LACGGDASGVEFVFPWPFFAVFPQAVLPEEFVGPKSDKLLVMHAAMGANVKTALILASIALAFFIGVMVRHWQW